MKMIIRRLLLVMAIIFFLLGGCHTQEGAEEDKSLEIADTGQKAPDMPMLGIEGGVVRLDSFKGKTVVLNFWATWCPPCREEMPLLQQAFVERQARGDLVVLAVDYEEPEALVMDFIRQFSLTFPVLMDRDGSVRLQYGVTGLPTTFFIDRDGVIR